MIDINRTTKVLAIIHYGRSGSLLVQSLFDSHPAVLMTPGTLLSYFFDFWELNKNRPLEELIETFVERYSGFFGNYDDPVLEREGLTRLGEERAEHIAADPKIFSSAMVDLLAYRVGVSRHDFFCAIHIAYVEATGRRVDEPSPWIVYHVHSPNPERIARLLEDFPEVLLLQTVRNPAIATASSFRFMTSLDRWSVGLGAEVLYYGLSGGTIFNAKLEGRWKALRLEDLQKFPRQYLEAVCEWMGLAWSDTLLESSFDGRAWWSGVSSPLVRGFNNVTTTQNYSEFLSNFDEFRLRVVLDHLYRTWEYSERYDSAYSCGSLFYRSCCYRRGWSGCLIEKQLLFPCDMYGD